MTRYQITRAGEAIDHADSRELAVAMAEAHASEGWEDVWMTDLLTSETTRFPALKEPRDDYEGDWPC